MRRMPVLLLVRSPDAMGIIYQFANKILSVDK
jgi:hypothetical protein